MALHDRITGERLEGRCFVVVHWGRCISGQLLGSSLTVVSGKGAVQVLQSSSIAAHVQDVLAPVHLCDAGLLGLGSRCGGLLLALSTDDHLPAEALGGLCGQALCVQ
eukprot:scaffold148859_cov19-Tisochrysis_lutea.AAC.1